MPLVIPGNSLRVWPIHSVTFFESCVLRYLYLFPGLLARCSAAVLDVLHGMIWNSLLHNRSATIDSLSLASFGPRVGGRRRVCFRAAVPSPCAALCVLTRLNIMALLVMSLFDDLHIAFCFACCCYNVDVCRFGIYMLCCAAVSLLLYVS